MLYVIVIICIVLFICFIVSTPETSKHCYYQSFYKKASEKFGEDYYYPLPTCRSIMQSDGTIIREKTHYKPVCHSTYSPFDKLEPWFLEIFRVDGGRNQFLERKFL